MRIEARVWSGVGEVGERRRASVTRVWQEGSAEGWRGRSVIQSSVVLQRAVDSFSRSASLSSSSVASPICRRRIAHAFSRYWRLSSPPVGLSCASQRNVSAPEEGEVPVGSRVEARW